MNFSLGTKIDIYISQINTYDFVICGKLAEFVLIKCLNAVHSEMVISKNRKRNKKDIPVMNKSSEVTKRLVQAHKQSGVLFRQFGIILRLCFKPDSHYLL